MESEYPTREMKTENRFLCVSDAGEITTEENTFWDVRNEIESAMRRRQTCGVVYGRGTRFFWRQTEGEHEPQVHLEFCRGSKVVERYDVPELSWRAFETVARQNGKTAKEYLTLLLGVGMVEGESLSEQIGWLFDINESDEVRHFRQASQAFHGSDAECVAPPMYGRVE